MYQVKVPLLNFSITLGREVLRYFMEDMTEYEQGEILDYPQVLTAPIQV